MTEDLIIILMSAAANLAGYPMPDTIPAVEYVGHQFFVDTMCGGVECNVIGGYLDADDPDTIYIDEQFAGATSLYALSFVLHELLHRSQYLSGEFDTNDCADSLEREREAYYAQNAWLIRNGHPPILRMVNGVCAKEGK